VAEGVSASSLQAGFVELASIVRALHGDWSAPAAGYDGWTCKDLLAHLSSTEVSLPAVVESSSRPPVDGATPFDPDRWNASQTRKRTETDPQELLNEFDMGTTRLVDVLTDATRWRRCSSTRSATWTTCARRCTSTPSPESLPTAWGAQVGAYAEVVASPQPATPAKT